MKELSDREIIDSVLSGKKENFTILVKRYEKRAYSLLFRMTRNHEDAEEVLQDSFVKAYFALPGFKGEAKFSTWFYRIVYNAGLSMVTSKAYKMKQQMSSPESEEAFGVENSGSVDNKNKNLYFLMNQLPVKNSLVMIMYYIDGLSLKEIGEVLGLSLQNTKVILYRSREKLKELLTKEETAEILL
ncbi:MAG: DNA-directed RNA polymerase sigma-70 factor [Melioribacteraceae bacterium]|nr:MAG: DNA-directed RNA polymerase sigma-70 factor [Melioribacteraceae bacterium]